MDMKSRSIAIAALALAAAVVIGYELSPQHPAQAATQPPAGMAAPSNPDELQYPNGAAQLEMIRAQVPAVAVPAGDTLSARVVYDEDVTARLGASVAGRVVAIKAAPGDRVRSGQVLAEIDSADFGAALADLSKAQADEERKRQVFERARIWCRERRSPARTGKPRRPTMPRRALKRCAPHSASKISTHAERADRGSTLHWLARWTAWWPNGR
jgi:cobalt-zinc-cadmium efflux system membrane fusion protein